MSIQVPPKKVWIIFFFDRLTHWQPIKKFQRLTISNNSREALFDVDEEGFFFPCLVISINSLLPINSRLLHNYRPISCRNNQGEHNYQEIFDLWWKDHHQHHQDTTVHLRYKQHTSIRRCMHHIHEFIWCYPISFSFSAITATDSAPHIPRDTLNLTARYRLSPSLLSAATH